MNKKNQTIEKKDFIIIILLLFFAMAFRIPFMPKNINFNNDATTYSDNIEFNYFDGNYDVQLPGYVSYIYLGRIINNFVHDTVFTQHIINILLILIITVFFYYLLKLLEFSFTDIFLYSLLFSFNSIILLGSITGGNRMFLVLASILLIFLSVRIIRFKEKSSLILFGFVLAFLSGFRQDLSFYFIPLYIYLIIVVKDLKITLISLLLFTATCLTWFVPLILEYGGIARYIRLTLGSEAIYDTSLIFAEEKLSPVLNILRVFVYIFYAFILSFIFFIASVVKRKIRIQKDLIIILLLSSVPALFFQLFVHNGNYVHLATFVVPFLIIFIYNYKNDSVKKIILSIVVILLLLSQFYFVKMFKGDQLYKKVVNVLFLQYSYDGVKSGETYRLKTIEEKNK